MGNQSHKHRDDFSKTIEDVDELFRETERVRSQVEDALRNRAFYPDRRRHSRLGEDRSRPLRDPRGPGNPGKDTHAA